MYIISQNKQVIAKMEEIYVIEKEYNFCIESRKVVFGTYATLEECLKIIEEIKQAILSDIKVYTLPK